MPRPAATARPTGQRRRHHPAAARDIVLAHAAQVQRQALAGEILPTTKPDWDNHGKLTDALKGIVWKDDSQVVLQNVEKVYGARFDRNTLRYLLGGLAGFEERGDTLIGRRKSFRHRRRKILLRTE